MEVNLIFNYLITFYLDFAIQAGDGKKKNLNDTKKSKDSEALEKIYEQAKSKQDVSDISIKQQKKKIKLDEDEDIIGV